MDKDFCLAPKLPTPQEGKTNAHRSLKQLEDSLVGFRISGPERAETVEKLCIL